MNKVMMLRVGRITRGRAVTGMQAGGGVNKVMMAAAGGAIPVVNKVMGE